jgi:hypothetical protein
MRYASTRRRGLDGINSSRDCQQSLDNKVREIIDSPVLRIDTLQFLFESGDPSLDVTQGFCVDRDQRDFHEGNDLDFDCRAFVKLVGHPVRTRLKQKGSYLSVEYRNGIPVTALRTADGMPL